MKALLNFASLLIAGGCAPAMQEPPDSAPDIPGHCRPDAVQRLIGQAQSEETGKQALRLSGAAQLRWIGPQDAISMDYAMDRINLETDGRRILRIYCG